MYQVGVYDRSGLYLEDQFAHFAAALARLVSLRKSYPHKFVQMVRLDSANVDCDGLTEEERDAVDNATPRVSAKQEDG